MADVEPDQVAAEGGVPKKRKLKSVMKNVKLEVKLEDVEPEVKLEPEVTPLALALERKRKDRNEERDEKELRRIYDHRKTPFEYKCDRFVYKNKAQIRFEKRLARYYERMENLTPFDAISRPEGRYLSCGGGFRRVDLNKKTRTRLTRLSNLALNKYNEENQDANFVFHGLVKSTWCATPCYTFYITFQAKAANDDVTKTFQAQVWDRFSAQGPPVVESCSLKPDQA